MDTNAHATFDIFNPKTRANPQAMYEQMRQEAPVYAVVEPTTGQRYWFFTRYDDCVAVLKDNRFGKEFQKLMTPEQLAEFKEQAGEFDVVSRHMLNLDPPDHTRLRELVHKAFTPRIIENLRPRIQQIANDLLDSAEGQTDFDLLDTYGFPLPITVIAELLGIPVADREQFRIWTKVLVYGTNEGDSRAKLMEFALYMQEMIEERQRSPKDDLMSNLVAVEEAGDKLNRSELLSMIFLLLVAGHETTVNLIGNGTLALLQHRDQFELLHDEPTLIKTAIEEMLRYNGPVETPTPRFAFADVPFGDQIIPRGDIVLPSLLGANRDPAYFADPNRFDIRRESNKHIAFGNGIHYCLGAPLARLEGEIAISTLVRRLPKLALNTPVESLTWNENILIHGLNALPVRI